MLILRFCGATKAAAPTTRLVKLSDVAGELPGSKPWSSAERRAQLAERREGVAHMVCD